MRHDTVRETQITIDEITIDLTLKKIRNVHIYVKAPDGRVVMTAPARMSIETIRNFATSKIDWIRGHRERLRGQAGQTQKDFVDGERHDVWGIANVLKVVVAEKAPAVRVESGTLTMTVRAGSDSERRRAVMDDWYRDQVRDALPPLIQKWEPVMGVRVDKVYVQRMKTRWGTCVPRKSSIRINTELACKPPECLEYVVIHELAHMIEPSHGPKFVALMDRYSPGWKNIRSFLNARPIPRRD